MEVCHENKDLATLLSHTFEGAPVHELHYRGRRCWLLAGVERAMGYAEGTLGDLIRREWSAEFEEGEHFAVIQGAELATLRKLLASVATESHTVANVISPKARSIAVLFVRGLDLAVLKSEKPVGQRLRRLLVEEVIPSVRETGSYVAPSVPDATHSLELEVRNREARLAQAKYLERAIEALGPALSLESRTALTLSAAEVATGESLMALRPAVNREGWKTPTEIATELNVTVARVGKAITALGLRQNAEGLAESYSNKADSSNRTVLCWRYTPKAVEMIRAHLSAAPKGEGGE